MIEMKTNMKEEITAKVFAENHQYDLAMYDEGGYIGIDTNKFEEFLESYHKQQLTSRMEELEKEFWQECTTYDTVAIGEDYDTIRTIALDPYDLIDWFKQKLIK